MTTSRLRLGQLLVDAHLLTQEALEDVLVAQQKDGRRLGTLLVERGHISEVQLTQILSHQLSVPWVSLLKIEFSRQLLNLVPREIAERYCLLPIYVRRVRGHGDTLYMAMEDPTNEEALRACAAHAGLAVRPMIAPPSDIRSAIRAYYGAPAAETEPPPPLSEQAPRSSPLESTLVSPGVDSSVSASAANAAPSRDALPPAASPTPAARRVRSQTLRSALFDEPGPTVAITSAPTGSVAVEAPPTKREPSRPPAPPAKNVEHDYPEIETHEIQPKSRPRPTPTDEHPAPIPAPKGKAPRMVALTLLDGTTITLPARSQKRPPGAVSTPPAERPSEPPLEPVSNLTARDLVAALRAVVGGADASAILGDDARWELMFAALLATLLKKQVIADWEFVEELNKLQKR